MMDKCEISYPFRGKNMEMGVYFILNQMVNYDATLELGAKFLSL